LTYQAYLRIQLGINALNGARYNEAADHFTTAINTGVLSPELAIHTRYEIFGIVRLYRFTGNAFMLNCVLCTAFRLGPHNLMANCTPESMPCIPSGG